MAEGRVQPRGRLHYAWVVLFCASLISAVASGVRMSFGVLIDPLVELYGWSVGAISLAYTLEFLSAFAVSVVAGVAADRIGGRWVLFLSVVVFTMGMLLTATISQLWQFYLYFGVLAGGLSLMGSVVVPVMLTRWFAKSQGVALGLMWAGLGIGPMLGAPLLTWLIATAGWRQAFFVLGAAAGGAMLVCCYFVRGRPADVGTSAYGETAARPGAGGEAPQAIPLGFGFVRRTPAFWHLINIHFLGCVGHSVFLAQIVYMAIRGGIPALTAAGVLSTMMGVSIVTRFATSVLTERMGGKKTFMLAFFLQAAPIPLLLWAREAWHFYLFAVIFGLGFGAEMTPYPITNKHYYGATAPLNTIYSWQLAGALAGMALGGWLGGALYDLTGAYTWSIAVGFLFNVAAFIPVALLPRHQPGKVMLAPAPSGGDAA